MSKPEAVLEYRLSDPHEFTCSLCPQETLHKAMGTFAIIGDLDGLVAAFKEHVSRWHTNEDGTRPSARIA